MLEPDSQAASGKKIRVITQVLTTALKLWLRAQVSQVSQIEVEIRASDRQILSGRIPWVSIFASHAVYQGLHVTQIQLEAENIRLNVGSVLKGQPLRLLETVPVSGEMIVAEKDLNDSLSSELLSTALNDVLVKLLPEHCPKSKPITWQKIILDHKRIILHGIPASDSELTFLEIFLGLELLNSQVLQLAQIQIQRQKEALLEDNYGYSLDLGSDVNIQELTLIPGQLVCRGRINVNP
ncbi:Protein of unknown function (DUF2993) [Cylindrospermum stagnale PCC 7417]|uniref:DUF2993 domain-containing protein n=1 Tax=Cylindrospermum stagnale PCC 7417 TaxID=56107 RepID=K9X4Y2_9NOST|nr:DUF2993 domain-containing protein [Cylindrospermum stagnale]AFZ27159.1 Protein of unknown function (DUF2993) [Cylindrospermum stagnale PCC 7417]